MIHERATLFEALDSLVPGSGCVGRQNGPNDEVYFSVSEETYEQAWQQAVRWMDIVLRNANLAVDYTIELQAFHQT